MLHSQFAGEYYQASRRRRAANGLGLRALTVAAHGSSKKNQPMSAGFKFLRSLGIVNRPYSAKKKAMTDATKQKFLVLYLIPASVIISTEAGGKTKRVTASSVFDTKNDIILCSFVETESHEVAAKAFENHPHLQIPQSSIEVMCVRPMDGM